MTGKLIAPLPAEIEGRSQAAGSKWRPFPKYKDSDVEWLGDIPEHWEVRRLKQICKLAYGDALAVDVRKQGSIPVYGSNGRVGFHSSANTKAPCLIVGRKGSFGKVNFSAEPVFAIDTTFFIDNRFSTADIRWLFYLLGWLRLDEISKDSAIPGLDREDAYQLSAVLPSTSEQHAIAAFLDRETAKIDDLIEKKRRLISLLEEKRAAIISHAVTNGLDPNAPMKDSGVEWLGEIQDEFEIITVRNLIRKGWLEIQDGNHGELHPKAEDYVSEGIPFLMACDIRNRLIDLESCKFISKEQADNLRIGFSKSNDVLLTHKGTLGETAIIPSELPYPYLMLTPQITYYRINAINEMSPEHICYFFQSQIFREQMTLHSLKQSTRGYVGISAQKEFVLILPSKEKQNQLVGFLNCQASRIEILISKIREAISKLQEYRSALISAAVTGKIDVREASL